MSEQSELVTQPRQLARSRQHAATARINHKKTALQRNLQKTSVQHQTQPMQREV